MRIVWWAFVILVSITRAQDDAASLAWSGVGEAAGDARPLGRVQPAALAWAGRLTVALSVVPSLHGLPGLRSGGAGSTVGGVGYGYGASVEALEAGLVRFLRVHGAMGLEIASGIAVGVGGKAGRWSFPRYAPLLEWEGGVGVQLRSERMITGLHITAKGQEGRPFTREQFRLVLGGAVRLSDAVTAIAEVVDVEGLEIQTGTRVMLLEEMSLIVSWTDGTNAVGGGCEVTIEPWQILAATRWHSLLGWTHGVTVSYVWR